jgi:hypothetical protein
MTDHFEFNGMGGNDLPTYNGMPPSTPHKPKPKPTPTIPQMEDRHARQVFADKFEFAVSKFWAWVLIILAVLFVGNLMYRLFFWNH